MANRRQAEMSRAEQVRARRQKSRKETPRVPFGSSVTRRPAPKNVTVTQEHQNSSGGHPQETYHHDSS